jgi:phosphohistidine phosphatase
LRLNIPMRRLLLLRHAKADRLQPGTRDHARGLTEPGRADAARIGLYLARHELLPDLACISPSARTLETWALAAAALRPTPPPRTEPRLYDATAQTLFKLVAEIPADSRAVMLVGHNPGLHEFALMLIASGDIDTRERLREELPTTGLAVIDFAFDDWSRLHGHAGRLERFVTPRSLEWNAM